MPPKKNVPIKNEIVNTPVPVKTKKLTEEEIDILVRAYEAQGVTQRSLAEDYNVSKSQVNRALMKRGENQGRRTKAGGGQVKQLIPEGSKSSQNPVKQDNEISSDNDNDSFQSFDDFKDLSEHFGANHSNQTRGTSEKVLSRKFQSNMHMNAIV